MDRGPRGEDLAEKLEQALREGKLYYAEIKDVTKGGKHGGISFGLFDISKGEAEKTKEGVIK